MGAELFFVNATLRTALCGDVISFSPSLTGCFPEGLFSKRTTMGHFSS